MFWSVSSLVVACLTLSHLTMFDWVLFIMVSRMGGWLLASSGKVETGVGGVGDRPKGGTGLEQQAVVCVSHIVSSSLTTRLFYGSCEFGCNWRISEINFWTVGSPGSWIMTGGPTGHLDTASGPTSCVAACWGERGALAFFLQMEIANPDPRVVHL